MPRWVKVRLVNVHRGIITVIEPSGLLVAYRQLGIDKLPSKTIKDLIRKGILDIKVMELENIPNNYALIDNCGNAVHVKTFTIKSQLCHR